MGLWVPLDRLDNETHRRFGGFTEGDTTQYNQMETWRATQIEYMLEQFRQRETMT